MNTRIALSTLSILAALGLMGGAAFAFVSDAGDSTENTFATGSFDLQLTDNNQGPQDNVDTTWNGTNMAPGGTAISAVLNFRNSGTITGNHIHFKATNTPTDVGNAEDLGPMQRLLRITSMEYDGSSILGLVPETNGNGFPDLEDLQSGGDGITLGLLNDLNSDHLLNMAVQLDSSADSTYLGDSVSTIFTATLHQDVSQ